MDLEYLNGNQEIAIKDNLKMIKEMELAKWGGLMDHIILDNGRMGFRMDMERWILAMA